MSSFWVFLTSNFYKKENSKNKYDMTDIKIENPIQMS